MSISEAAQAALAAQKHESVSKTRQKLKLALQRLIDGAPHVVKINTRISAASVAKEAGVDRVTLYRYHEPVLSEIRKINDTSPKAKLKENNSELAQIKARLKEYRQLVEDAQGQVTDLARINYRLDARISELEELVRIRDERISEFQKQLNERNTQLRITPLK
jgi:vacuolar-type H+-ATPase subunit I/STV1